MGKTKTEQRRAQAQENRRLKSALSAIHDALHRNDANRAHELCECALDGEEVAQPNITAGHGAKLQDFIARFNRDAGALGLMACSVIFVPSKTDSRKVSVQLGGNVAACKLVEQMFGGGSSTYMGEHSAAEVPSDG